jgi:hypothetical protein
MISQKKGVMGVEETEFDSTGQKNEYTFEKYITCPYCGHQNKDSWECTNDDGEIDCGACGSTFFYERIVDVSYSTSPIKPINIITIHPRDCKHNKSNDKEYYTKCPYYLDEIIIEGNDGKYTECKCSGDIPILLLRKE